MFDRIFGNNNNTQSTSGSTPAVSTLDPQNAQPAQSDPVTPAQTPPVPSFPSIDVPVAVPPVPQEVPPPAPVVPVPEVKPEAPVVEVPQSTVPQEPVVVQQPQEEQKAIDVPIDEEYKNKIGLQLTEAMLKGIDEGNMTESEMGVVSGYILDNIDNIHTHADLNVFLQYLAQRWKVFKQVQKVERGVEKVGEDSAKADEIAGLIHENKIEDALAAAHNATAAIN